MVSQPPRFHGRVGPSRISERVRSACSFDLSYGRGTVSEPENEPVPKTYRVSPVPAGLAVVPRSSQSASEVTSRVEPPVVQLATENPPAETEVAARLAAAMLTIVAEPVPVITRFVPPVVLIARVIDPTVIPSAALVIATL